MLGLKFEEVFTDMGGYFKFQAQDSFLEKFFWEILKTNLTFWKKVPLPHGIKIGMHNNLIDTYWCSLATFCESCAQVYWVLVQ